jgi:hypothetical protein
MAPKVIRGTLLVLYQLQVIVGCVPPSYQRNHYPDLGQSSIFISYVIDLGTHHLEGSASWRIPIGLQLVWGGVMLSGVLFLPESPYAPSTILARHTHTNDCSVVVTRSVTDARKKPQAL